MTRGRPKIHKTPEEKAQAKADWVKASKAKVKNITVDIEIQDQLNAYADSLEAEFGFRPTLSQTLKYLLNKAIKK